NLLPLMVGMFWGAPLLAREHELGTDVLAWSQTVSRRRWLTVKLSALAAAAAVAATGFSLLFGWWFGPFADLAIHGGQSRIQPNIFDVQGIVPIAYTLFAFALGTAAGAVIRRTVPAMAVTVGGFLAARLGIQAFRGHMLRPLRSVHSLVGPTGDVSLGSPLVGAQNWVLQSDIVDHGGHVVSDQTVLQTCQAVVNPGGVVDCIASHGYRQVDIYQPLSRYWPLQGIESAVFVMLAMALLAATIYSVVGKHHHRHRHSVVSSAPTAHKHNLALTASASRRAQVRASTAV
ncbi:MAG: ABC transporter permease subunit, partial [Acidimicrobiales bacterium]